MQRKKEFFTKNGVAFSSDTVRSKPFLFDENGFDRREAVELY